MTSVWQPIETAPKDRPIVTWVEALDDHCPNCNLNNNGSLCLYHAHAEGLSRTNTGPAIVVWGGAWQDSWEDGGGGLPDWWFRAGSDFEEAANPTHWMPCLLDPPETEQ